MVKLPKGIAISSTFKKKINKKHSKTAKRFYKRQKYTTCTTREDNAKKHEMVSSNQTDNYVTKHFTKLRNKFLLSFFVVHFAYTKNGN